MKNGFNTPSRIFWVAFQLENFQKLLVFDIYQKLRSEGNLIKDPFQLLPGSTRGTYSQSVLEKKKMQRIYININKSKPSCLIAHTLDPKFLEKIGSFVFFFEGIKKLLYITSLQHFGTTLLHNTCRKPRTRMFTRLSKMDQLQWNHCAFVSIFSAVFFRCLR